MTSIKLSLDIPASFKSVFLDDREDFDINRFSVCDANIRIVSQISMFT